MKKVVLKRIAQDKEATYGALIVDGTPKLFTLEELWRDNQRNISCIPAGQYPIVKWVSQKHGRCWMVRHVPDRSAILIHAGNTTRDTMGCILLGTIFSRMGGLPAVLDSRRAMETFNELLRDCSEATLEIADHTH